MDLPIPDDLVSLKTRIDAWIAQRKHKTQRVPKDLKAEVCEFAKHYPKDYLRKVLKITDRWFGKTDSKHSARSKSIRNTQAEFFKLPVNNHSQPQPTSRKSTDYRIQLERPDGTRLTVALPNSESASIFKICSEFLKDEV